MHKLRGSLYRACKDRSYNFIVSRFATTLEAIKPHSDGAMFNWRAGETSSSLPPLDCPMEVINLPPPVPDCGEPSKVKITTLSNGVRVASETSCNPAVSLGLYVDCGSVYENPVSYGSTHLLEKMAFKGTTNRSDLQIVRQVEAIGGHLYSVTSRELMGYIFVALKTYIPRMVELLVDCVRNPIFLDQEVNEQLRNMRLELQMLSMDPGSLLLEILHSTGYRGALANSFLATEAALSRLNGRILKEFISENYTSPRMVLTASGIEHEELLSFAEPLLSDLPGVPQVDPPTSAYVGGDHRCQGEPGICHVALAFEIPGGLKNEKDSIVATVLQKLMGGGHCFSAGGPGKGMHSRLYRHILEEFEDIYSISAFNSLYNDTGIFGLQVSSAAHFAEKAVGLAVNELKSIASFQVSQVELDRAKQATKAAALMELEERMVRCEYMARQILTFGESKPVERLVDIVDAITLDDVAECAQKLISSPLTMVSCGDVANVPSYDSVQQRFH